MHTGIFVFAQIVQFLPQRQFRRILAKYNDRTKGWSMFHWNLVGVLRVLLLGRDELNVVVEHMGYSCVHLLRAYQSIEKKPFEFAVATEEVFVPVLGGESTDLVATG